MLAIRMRQKESVFYLAAYRASDLLRKVQFVGKAYEGEEESDSEHLAPLLSRQPEFYEGDGALIEGGGVDEKGRPVLVCGVRGMFYVELSVRTLAFDAHSGGAQLLPNAAWRLIEALHTMRTPDGTITIDGLYTAGSAPGTFFITAVSATDFSALGVAQVTIAAGGAEPTVVSARLHVEVDFSIPGGGLRAQDEHSVTKIRGGLIILVVLEQPCAKQPPLALKPRHVLLVRSADFLTRWRIRRGRLDPCRETEITLLMFQWMHGVLLQFCHGLSSAR